MSTWESTRCSGSGGCTAFEKFKRRMVDLCAAYGVVHVDLEPVFEGRSDEWMAPDKLHPNNRGTYAIAAAILAALEGN